MRNHQTLNVDIFMSEHIFLKSFSSCNIDSDISVGLAVISVADKFLEPCTGTYNTVSTQLHETEIISGTMRGQR